ncbi:MAG: Hpt domain-containing protein, partial [Cyanobacteriota bacterium]
MSLDKEKYITLFIDESRENLLALNGYLLELEKGSGDLKNLNDIFRVAHTLKGMSSTMGFDNVAELTHEMENLLDMLRNAQIIISSEIIDTLFSCLDALETLIENISDNTKEIDVSNIVEKIKTILDSGEIKTSLKKDSSKVQENHKKDIEIIYSNEEKELILEAFGNSYNSSEIKIFLMKDCVMKSLRVSLVLQAIESKAKIIKTTPSRESLLAENFFSYFVVTILHSVPIEKILHSILCIAEISSAENYDLKEKFIDEIKINTKNLIPVISNKIIPKYDEEHKKIISIALEENFKCYEIYITLDKETIMKAIRVSMIMNTLEYLEAQIVVSFPSGNDLLNENNFDNFVITIISDRDSSAFFNAISSIAEIKEIEVLELSKDYLKNNNQALKKEVQLPLFTDYEKMLILEAKSSDRRSIIISINFMSGTIMKFARFILVTKKLEGLGDIIKTIPSQEEIENENFDDSFQIVLITNQNDNDIINAISSVAEIKNISDLFSIDTNEKNNEIKLSKQTQTYYNEHNVPKKIELTPKLDSDNQKNEKIKDKTQKEEPKINKITLNNNELKKIPDKKIVKEEDKNKKPTSKKQTIRVDTDRLDQLINMVEELVIIRSRLNKLAINSNNQEINQSIRNLNLISSTLQNSAMKLRMMPVESIFSRFPRMIRDVAKASNKEINFVIEGEDTEIDRTIIDELGDPLVHLLRNSADHGIESTEDRIKAGKTKNGNIHLIAKHEGNSVLIIVEDDGAGINIERVKQKAIEKNIITQDEAYNMSEEEAFQIIFLPGFSTMEATTELSGRGVGMDAVLSKVKSLGGNIIINSKKGLGSKFTIKLPLTLAIMEVLLVKLENEIYAIPLSYIEEVKEIYLSEIKNIHKVRVTVVRDKTIPLVLLKEILNVPEKIKEPEFDFFDEEKFEELIPIIIVRTEEGNKTSGFIVDSILGQDDIVIKPLSKIASD